MPSLNNQVASQTDKTALPLPTVSQTPQTPIIAISPATAPSPDRQATASPKPKLKSSDWSVVYNPEVKKVLDLRITHVFAFKCPVYCAKISPDGQRVAIGLEDNGKTYINDVKTGKNI
jgi:WD40 repeat protein